LTQDPLVSVVVTIYKEPEYLNQALESVTQQTFDDYEIIVVDDCSGEEYTAQYRLPEKAKLICHSQNTGPAGARNTGIGAARGKFIAFMDGDDVWLEDKLSIQVKALEDNPDAGLVFCHYKAVDVLLNPTGNETKPRASLQNPLKKLCRGCIIRTPSCVLMRRDVVLECGLFDESLWGTEDWDYWLRIARKHRILALPDQLTLYRMHSAQLHKKKTKMHAAKLSLMNKSLCWAKKERPDMLNCVRRNYGRMLRQLAAAKAYEEKNLAEAWTFLKRAISIWPYSIQTYSLAGKLLLASYR
jgi:glycosyltransferase involved in cell wall biosynthesis